MADETVEGRKNKKEGFYIKFPAGYEAVRDAILKDAKAEVREPGDFIAAWLIRNYGKK